MDTSSTRLSLPSEPRAFGFFVDGAFVPAGPREVFERRSPGHDVPVTRIPKCTTGDLDMAVDAARAAFDDRRWSGLGGQARAAVLLKAGALIRERAEEIAYFETLENGKPISQARGEVAGCADMFDYASGLARSLHGDSFNNLGDGMMGLVTREPVGVVGLVLPWNFPALMLAWKIGPALAAGCSVVVKPAEETSLTALRIAELAYEAGVPRGVFNVVLGSGSAVGEPLGRHPDVDAVSFTGSTFTGRRFLHYAADSNLKEVTLELGGKNPAIVLDDAENLDAVAAHVVNGAFWNMGENCSAISRLIVQKGIKDALLEKVKAHAREWPVGDPLDPETRVGALVSQAHRDKVCSYLERTKGDVLHLGGKADGMFVEPTVVEVTKDDRRAQEEIFGPILSVIEVASFEEAIAVANDTDYGLAASIFTANGKRALRGARMLRAGTVTVNSYGEGDISTPFGGYKTSGFGGRDNGVQAHDQYTQLKTIWVDLTDNADTALD